MSMLAVLEEYLIYGTGEVHRQDMILVIRMVLNSVL